MNWLLAAVSGVLLVLVFPRFDIVWLAPFALTPLIMACAREPRWLRRFSLGYVTGLIYWCGVNNWIQYVLDRYGGTGATVGWALFGLFCLAKALHMGAFALLAGWAIRVPWAAIAIPALWVAIEWTHGPLGFAWLDLGNAAIDMEIPMTLAPITGVYGLSFLFVLMSMAVALPLLRRPRWQTLPVLLVMVMFVLPPLPKPAKGQASAVLVQPDIPDDKVWEPASFQQTIEQMQLLSLIGGRDPAKQPDLLVWPEVPAPFYEKTPEMAEVARQVGKGGHTCFLSGVIGQAPGGEPLNSAALWSPDGTLTGRYDKVNLVPFGEFVPWPLGAMARKISTGVGDFEAGKKVVVFQENGHEVGTFICYESVFPRFIRRFALEGAEALFNISNDSWFGKSPARYQHLEIVRMRAAENRRWILRSTNDGITASIDPAGRLVSVARQFEAVSVRVGFNYRDDITFYTRWGDWFVAVCALAAAAACVAGFKRPV